MKLISSMRNLEWDESASAPGPVLKQSGGMFDNLFERSRDAIWLYDPQTARLVDCNQAAVTLIGAETKQQLLQTRPEDLSPLFQPDGSRSSESALAIMAAVEKEKSCRFEWTIRRLDGRDVPVEVSSTALEMGGKSIHALISRDISERKTAERALRESEAKFRALFEGSSQGVVLQDENGLLEMNPASVRIMRRRSPEELVGKHPSELAPILQPCGERSEEMARRYVAQCLALGSARFEWTASAPNGEEIPLEVALTRIQWSGREVIQAFITDITERKRAQAALAESEARFSAAFQASPICISLARMSDARYVLVNDAHLNWLGYPREKVLGRTCLELGIWEDPAERVKLLEDILAVGSVRQRECRWRNRKGERFTMLLAVEAIQLNDTPHILSMALDITQRKRAEEELVRSLAREKELSQLKSNFVSMVSHEFRTPLGIIQSSAELLREFYPRMEAAERNEQLGSIARNTRRMAGMMEDILMLSRLEAGKLECRPVAVDLASFCRRVVDEVLSATNRRCPIELSLESDLPQASVDERLLRHILTNLLSNAVKYSRAGQATRFCVSREGTDAGFVIVDEGIGISPDDQPRLFTAFHRGQNVGSRPGTGLGLLVVKRCAELHQGKVQIESRLGHGTTVTVKLAVFQNSGYEKNTGDRG